MPTKYHDKIATLYDDSIECIKSQEDNDVILGMKILQWLAFAKIPMTVDELRHALALEWEEDEEPPVELNRENILDIPDIVDVCAGLVLVEEQSSIVRLVHSTTQEYLNQKSPELFPHGADDVARVCIAYLSFTDFASGHQQSDVDLDNRIEHYPFLRYASQTFGAHLRGQPESKLEGQALLFFKESNKISAFAQVYYTSTRVPHKGYSQDFPRNMNGLHVTAFLGLSHINARLLCIGLNPNEKDSSGRTPLHYASSEGYLKIMEQVQGASIEARDNHGKSALHYAVENGQKDAVYLLLKLGAGMESSDGGYSAMQLAGRWGHEYMIDAFLDKGAELETKTFWLSTALHIAAECGQQKCVKKLLDHGAQVDPRDKGGQTPLYLAAVCGFGETVDLILAYGATIHQGSYDQNKTMLHTVAEKDNSSMVKTLLEKGANVNRKDAQGRTALHHAALAGSVQSIKYLLSYGALALEEDSNGHTAYDCADLLEIMGLIRSAVFGPNILTPYAKHGMSAERELSSKQPLDLQSGQSLKDAFHATNSKGQQDSNIDGCLESPLHDAAWSEDIARVQLCLDRGENENITALSKCTPLHLASARGSAVIVLVLLERGADSRCRTTYGRSPLDYAISNGHIDVLRILIEWSSLDRDSDFEGRTALHNAAYYDRPWAIQILTEAGADCRAIDNRGRTPLHRAAERGHWKSLRILLDADPDGDIDVLDHGHYCALHLAAFQGHRPVVELLLIHGASKNVKDPSGLVASDLADIGRHRELVYLLTAPDARKCNREEN